MKKNGLLLQHRLGAKRISPALGIVWNDEMDDFSIPGQPNSYGYAPSPANYIRPGKRPLSSMSPTVVYNRNTGMVKAYEQNDCCIILQFKILDIILKFFTKFYSSHKLILINLKMSQAIKHISETTLQAKL